MFAFLIAALVRPDPRDAEISALKAQVDNLTRDCNDWRLLAEGWRNYAQAREATAQALGLQQYPQNPLSGQQQQYQQGLLGAQNLDIDREFRNCTPGRHDLFVRDL